MISSPHLATTLLFYVSRPCSQYLNRCVATSDLVVVEAQGVISPFYLEPILVKMEGGRYLNPILPVSMADLVVGRRSSDGGGPKTSSGSSKGGDCESGGGNKKPSPKVAATGGPARVRVRYNAHLPSLSLRGGENSRYILAGAVLPTLHGHVLCKNWHLCGVCWEDCKRKNSHPPNPPEVATTISGLLKVARGG